MSEGVKDAIHNAIEMHNGFINFERQIQANEQKFSSIVSDQNRIRSNMGSVDRNSELYRCLLIKLDTQETRIEELGNRDETLKEQRDRLS